LTVDGIHFATPIVPILDSIRATVQVDPLYDDLLVYAELLGLRPLSMRLSTASMELRGSDLGKEGEGGAAVGYGFAGNSELKTVDAPDPA